MAERRRRRGASGRGTLRKREARPGHPARWEGRFTYYADGLRRQGSVYGATQHEAAQNLDAALRRLGRGFDPEAGRQPMAEYLTTWAQGREHSLRPRTWDTYCSIVREHLAPDLGRIKLAELTPQMVNAYLRRKLESGLSPRTIAHHRAVLRTALHDAMRYGHIERNAAALSDPPRVPAFDVRVMEPEEAGAILRAVADTELEGPVAVSLWGGLRIGETLGLQWGDIDSRERVLHVRRALMRRAGATTLVEPKSRSSRRNIPMPIPLVEALERHRAREAAKRRTLGLGGPGSDDLVFTAADTGPLKPSALNRRFRTALTAAGMRSRRWHDLRHGCATLLLASGADLKVVSAILGHASISLTGNTYAAVVDALKRDASDRLTALVSAAPTPVAPRT